MKTKVGRLIYLNSLPVYYGIESGAISFDADLICGIPAELNQWLAEGNLDLSPISSIEYARHQEDYLLIPHLCLNSVALVKSVMLISKIPIEHLNQSRIALSSASATSQVLLKIILTNHYRHKPEYKVMQPNLTEMLQETDAALLIGDDTLATPVPENLYQYDLGKLWQEFCGYPVIFVVWAVRKEYAEQNKQQLHELTTALKESLSFGLKHLGKIAEIAKQALPKAETDMRDYYTRLGYDLNEQMLNALLFYYDQAALLNLCPKCRQLQFFNQ
ncbi:MAG: menaquinone biosynthesis protein [bacterium]|nr:menaquinone biosynthesis protein [bacterium]